MKLLHTMLRVGNLQHSISFYCDVLGMRLLRQSDYPGGRFTLAFLGYADETECTALELTHNWDTDSYEMGTGFGHLAIQVPDVYQACEDISAKGGEVVRPAGPMKHGSTVLAFVKDPDGYMIELLGPKSND